MSPYAIVLTKINGFSAAVNYSIAGCGQHHRGFAPNPASGDSAMFISAGGSTGGTVTLRSQVPATALRTPRPRCSM
jgi:hypothetical protein